MKTQINEQKVFMDYLSDIGAWVLGGAMFIYLGYRSLDFLTFTFREEDALFAYLALFSTTIGAVIFAVIWQFFYSCFILSYAPPHGNGGIVFSFRFSNREITSSTRYTRCNPHDEDVARLYLRISDSTSFCEASGSVSMREISSRRGDTRTGAGSFIPHD